jgi:hypothetical protein
MLDCYYQSQRHGLATCGLDSNTNVQPSYLASTSQNFKKLFRNPIAFYKYPHATELVGPGLE